MLQISVPSNGPSRITFTSFMNYLLPVPSQGIASANDNHVILLFDNEQKVIDYAKELKQLHGSQKKAANEVITSIVNYFRSKIR